MKFSLYLISKHRNMAQVITKINRNIKNISKIIKSPFSDGIELHACNYKLKGKQFNREKSTSEVTKTIIKIPSSIAVNRCVTAPHLATVVSSLGSGFLSKQFSTSPISDLKHAFIGPSDNKACTFDIAIVGGGIVGTATARELSIRYPSFKLALIEKEDAVSLHQSDRNSGVIHAGIYYAPNSVYAKICVRGCELMYQYCAAKNINYSRCGKIIVAVYPSECGELLRLYKNSLINKVVGIRMIGEKEIRQIEPNCLGIRALHSPNTGCVFYKDVTESLAQDFMNNGGRIFFGFLVDGFGRNVSGSECHRRTYPLCIHGGGRCITAKYAVVCAGLYADRLALKMGGKRDPVIMPIRGTFMELKPQYAHLVKGNIYPVTDPRNPFPGVHLTKRADGNVFCGPAAFLALHREGYKWYKINLRDCADIATYGGCYRLVLNFHSSVWKENLNSINRMFMTKYLKRYIPMLKSSYLCPTKPGVAAIGVTSRGLLEKDLVMEIPKVRRGMDEIVGSAWLLSQTRCHHLLSLPHRALVSDPCLRRREPSVASRERYCHHFRRYQHPRYRQQRSRSRRRHLQRRFYDAVSRSRRTRRRGSGRSSPPERLLFYKGRRRRPRSQRRPGGGQQRRFSERLHRHRRRRLDREDRHLPPLPPWPLRPSRLH